MTPEERQLLAGLFDRTRAASSNYRDPEAERFIADAVREQSYAPYLLAQTVIVQDQALQAANQRLQELESRVHELESQAASQQGASGGFLGGIGKSIFGSSPQAEPPRASVPPAGGSPWSRTTTDSYAPQAAPAPSPWQQGQAGGAWAQPSPQQGGWSQPAPQQQGGGFLRGALGAAAGVAGGVLLANSISGLFSGHNNHLGIGSGLDGLSGVGGSSGFDPLPSGRIGDAEPPAAAPAAFDSSEDEYQGSDDNSSDWGNSSDDTQDV